MNDTIARIVDAALSHELDGKDAALYTAYRRLEKAGCLRICLNEEQPADQRRYCVITSAGGRRRQGKKAHRKNKIAGGMSNE